MFKTNKYLYPNNIIFIMDAVNTPIQHTIVGIFTAVLMLIMGLVLKVPWSTALGRVSFILLFLALLIGPVMKLKKPSHVSSPLKSPWGWRGELGIWFALTGLIHFIVILLDRPFSELIKIGGSGYALANLLGLVALVWALILTIASFGKVIRFLGVDSWKWLHSFSYVVFYLVSAHFIYFQFFSTYGEVGPDWFGYLAVSMVIVIIILQLTAFVMTLMKREPIVLEES